MFHRVLMAHMEGVAFKVTGASPVQGVTDADAPGEGQGAGLVTAQEAAATLAGGRQQLPPWLPAEMADAQPGLSAHAPGQGHDQPVLSPSIMTDDSGRQGEQALQPQTAHPALLAPERPHEPTRAQAYRDSLTMQLPLRAQGWDHELAQRIVWMAGRQAQWAEISLNPPSLGKLEVHLSLNGVEASAYFYSPHAAVREAIDESLPRLREMFSGAGINLAQTQVSQESFSDRRGEREMPYATTGQAIVEHGPLPTVINGRGLVDLYV